MYKILLSLSLIIAAVTASAINEITEKEATKDPINLAKENVREPRDYKLYDSGRYLYDYSPIATSRLVVQHLPTSYNNEGEDIQFQYQNNDSQLGKYVLDREHYNIPESRRYYRQTVGTYYPISINSPPRYQVNEKSQYQLQANAQRYAEGDYGNYDHLNSRYQSQEQASYQRHRSRF